MTSDTNGSFVIDFLRKTRNLYILPPVLLRAFTLYVPLSFVNVTSWKLYLPLLRSIVVCDVPVTQYSGSLYCGDVNQVMSVALLQEAWLVAVKLVLRMISGPILGALCDQHGRKTILMLSIGGFTVSCFLMFLACVQTLVPPVFILTIAMVIQGCTTAFGLCFKGMVADALPKEERAKGFVVMNHADVLSRAITIVLVIAVQKAQILHYDWLCLIAVASGLVLLLCCHCFLHETLPAAAVGQAAAADAKGGDAKAVVAGQGSLWRLFAARTPALAKPMDLLSRSHFLKLQLLQRLLLQMGNGWESVQDSFAISVLGWGPGDWDLFNVPISTGREVWGMLMSGVMVHWAANRANLFWYVQASTAFMSTMFVIQNFAPWGPAFLLLPRYLMALVPNDGGATDVFFSSQFAGEDQATAQGLLTAADNMMSGLGRWLFAYCFNPAARGLAATHPLLARSVCLLLSNAVCIYTWRTYGGLNGHDGRRNGKKDE